MRIIKIAVLVVLLNFTLSVLHSQDNEAKFVELITKGVNALRHSDFAKAEQYFKKAIAVVPTDDTGYYNLACVYARWSEILKGEAKQKIQKKAIKWLRKAIVIGFNDLDHLKNDMDLKSIRTLPEFKQVITDLEYLLAGALTLDDAEPLPTKLQSPEKYKGEPLPILAMLVPWNALVKNTLDAKKFVGDNQFALLQIFNTDKEKPVATDKPWHDFAEIKIRKTINVTAAEKAYSGKTDFDNVFLLGIGQSGYAAVRTFLADTKVFKNLILIDTPMFPETSEFKKLRKLKDKAQYSWLVYHSKSDTLAFAQSVKSYKALKKAGFKIELKTGDLGVNPFKILLEHKNEIVKFVIETAKKRRKAAKNKKDAHNK